MLRIATLVVTFAIIAGCSASSHHADLPSTTVTASTTSSVSAPASTTSPPAASSEQIAEVAAVGESTAWVVTDRRVLRTDDDGRSWTPVGRLPTGVGNVVGAFADSRNGVIAWIDAHDQHVYAARVSANGIDAAVRLERAETNSALELFHQPNFYTLVGRDGECSSSCASILSFSDNGRTWRSTALGGFVETVRCVGHETCWATTTRNRRAALIRSVNTGRSWHTLDVSLPPPVAPELASRAHVILADANDFIVEVDRPTGNFYAVSFVASHDDGRTFVTRDWPDTDGAPNPNGTGPPFLAVAHDANRWTVALYDAVYRTRDSGLTWQRFPLRANAEVVQMSWATADTGWIAAQPADSTQNEMLLRTDNGAKSWHPVPLP